MKILGNFLATIVSILYAFVLLAIIILVFASNAFSSNYYQDVLKDIDMNEIKLEDLGVSSFEEEFGADASVEDVLVKSFETVGISKKDAVKIMNSEEINKVVGDLFSDAVGYLAGSEELPQITYQDALKIVKGDEIASKLENVPNDEEIKELVDEANELIKNLLKGEISK